MTIRRALRVVGRVIVGFLLAGAILGLIFHRWVEAEGRAIIALTRTSNTPVLSWAIGVFTDEPRAEETTLGGQPAFLVRPGEGRAWPAIVFLNGVTRRGRFHPTVRRLARALARAGYLVAVPDPPGLRDGILSVRTLAGTKAAIAAVAARPDVDRKRVTLFGVSVGASLALLAAEDSALAAHVRAVVGLAPYTNLADVVRIATTSTYAEQARVHRYRSKPFAALVAARSLTAALPHGHERMLLLRRLLAISDHARHPLAALRGLAPARRNRPARALLRLLGNRRPAQFTPLYAALPKEIRRSVALLSPLNGARRLRCPILIASAPHDKYFPPEQTRELARRGARVTLTVTPTLQHAIPHFSVHDLAGLVRFDRFLVRALRVAG